MSITCITYYTATVEYETDLDWVAGCDPKKADWKLKKRVIKIQAPNEYYAKLWIEEFHMSPSTRNLKIGEIKEKNLFLDAIITIK